MLTILWPQALDAPPDTPRAEAATAPHTFADSDETAAQRIRQLEDRLAEQEALTVKVKERAKDMVRCVDVLLRVCVCVCVCV